MMMLLVLLKVLAAAILLGTSLTLVSEVRPAGQWLLPLDARRAIRIGYAIITALGGIGMLTAIAVPILAFFAALLSVIAAVLIGLHPAARTRPRARLAPVLLGLAALGVGALQPLGLRVMALPHADDLPYRPVPARVVKTYAAGTGFESVRAGADGTLYLAANQGLDFTIQDYYRRATGEVIARRPDGRERVLFTTPTGSTAGALAIAHDGTIFMTSNGRRPGIWRIGVDGAARMIASLPSGAWPNGLDFGPDGMLYTPDSSLAQVWRIDPRSGRFEIALHDRQLAARRFIALAPGANGLHFAGRTMLVTVSDSTQLLGYPLGQNGRFGAAQLVAGGIPGDDFAIGSDGSLFVTTHPYNTLVRVVPGGGSTIIGNASQHIVGATDACFGTAPGDRNTLYVATDGGAFTEGAAARAQLVALTIK
jgi:sugar lactone lactonase YvrE